MSNSVNISNFGNFGVLTLGREFGGALKDFSEHLGAKVGTAIENESEKLGHFFDQVEFLQKEGNNLAETYTRAIFNTSMAMNRENVKVNGHAPAFDSRF